jgi:hypothetical protein
MSGCDGQARHVVFLQGMPSPFFTQVGRCFGAVIIDAISGGNFPIGPLFLIGFSKRSA